MDSGKRTPRPAEDTWPGGYIRRGKKRSVYVIERWVGGKRYHVSTRATRLNEAMKHLFRFESNPAGYSPTGEELAPVGRKPLYLTSELAIAYRDWMLRREKPASRTWAFTCANFLADWAEDLSGIDLRDVSIQRDLKPAVERRVTSRKQRIEVIKAFFGYLRRERGLMKFAEDPTLDLPVPNMGAAKNRRKRAVEQERVAAVLPHLPEWVRDIILLQTATAWHQSEVRRFAEQGEIVRPKNGGALAVLVTPHKSGELTRTPLQHQEHLEVAERIRARGKLPDVHRISEAMTAACEKARVPVFHSGDMRHTVLTWAHEDGAPMHDVAAFAHHRSERTTRTFYVDVAEPAPRVPVRLFSVINGGKKTPA